MNDFLEALFKFIYYASHEKKAFDLLPIIISLIALILTVLSSAFTVITFFYKDKKEDLSRDRNVKLDWYKSLILNINFPILYSFFDNVEVEMRKLQNIKITIKKKQSVNDLIVDHRNLLKKSFIDILQVVDENLHKQILRKIDDLIDPLTEEIFLDVDFNNPEKFDELVLNRISETKISTINSLYNYKG